MFFSGILNPDILHSNENSFRNATYYSGESFIALIWKGPSARGVETSLVSVSHVESSFHHIHTRLFYS